VLAYRGTSTYFNYRAILATVILELGGLVDDSGAGGEDRMVLEFASRLGKRKHAAEGYRGGGFGIRQVGVPWRGHDEGSRGDRRLRRKKTVRDVVVECLLPPTQGGRAKWRLSVDVSCGSGSSDLGCTSHHLLA
jgi:hypothetical protein